GVELDGEQVAYSVGVLAAIEAARGHATRVGLHVAVGLFEFAGEELNGLVQLRWSRYAFRRHFAGAHFAQDDVPSVTAGGERGGLGERGDIHAAGCEAFA